MLPPFATIIDLTHLFAEPMPVFPGDPPARLRPGAVADGCPYYEASFGMHVGTHLDAPLHMIPHGTAISSLSVERFVGRGVLIDARGHREIGAELLKESSLESGCIVLVLTGHSAVFHRPEYFETYPEISASFASKLSDAGVSILGLDTPSPDREPYSIHKQLLSHDVLILENLTNLESLLGVPLFEVIALPIRFQAEAAPARVIARILS